MKKLMTIFAILFATITFGQVLGDFPVSPNQGGETEAANRQRIADDGGLYLSNIAPHQLDVLTSYGIVADNLMIVSGRKASVLYSQFPTDGTGDFTVINAAVKNEIVDGKLREIAANIAGFNYKFGFPVLEVNEATENLIEDPVTLGSDYWAMSGATIASDPSTKGSDQNVSSTANGDYTTFGGASATGFAATSNGGATHEAGTADEIVVTASNIIRVAFTLTLNSGTAPTVALKDALAGANIGNSKTQVSTAGANDMYFYGSSATTGVIEFSNTSTTTDFVIADLSVSEVTGFPSPSVDLPVSGFKLTEDDQNSTHLTGVVSVPVSNTTSYTFSVYAKQGERSFIVLRYDQGVLNVWFDIDNGTVGTEQGTATGTITALSNGWYRCKATYTTIGTDFSGRIYLADADNNVIYTGDGSSGAYIAFPQLEEKLYASTWTFIAEGGTSSRIADQINNSAYIESSEGGTLYAEIAAFADDGNDRYISISDGSVANAIQLYYSSTTNQIVGKIIVGSATQATLTYTLSDETEFAKCLVSWATDNFTLVVNGVERATDVSGSVPAFGVLDEISLDDGGGGNDFYGYIKELASLGITTTTERVNITTQ